MTHLLMLDAAYPPDPGSLITDITTVQANGAFLYVWGPYVNGTPAHVRALQAAGLYVAPIVVPGNIPPTPDMLVNTVYAWGFHDGPVFFDFERGSDPGKPWFDAAEAFFKVHGYHAEPYGTLATLGQYDPDDKDWVAYWIRTGVLDPLPQLLPDWEAWQFVNDITINGHQYDASVVSASLFAPAVLSPFRGGNMGPFVHPTIAGRHDYVYVNSDHSVTHAWTDGQHDYAENLGGSAVPGFVGGAWLDEHTLALTVVGDRDGQLYAMQLPIGGPHSDWLAIFGKAALPSTEVGPTGPSGPAGPPGKDGIPQPGTYSAQVVFPTKS